MRYCPHLRAGGRLTRGPESARHRSDGSVLLVVLGVLTVLSLVGLSLVLFARTESKTARNFRLMAEAELLLEGELERLKPIVLEDMYPSALTASGTCWRLLNESHDYSDANDAFLFGFRGDGSGVLQVSFGGSSTPTVNNDARDATLDSVWRTFSLSSGLQARVATQVIDHGGLAHVNAWGNMKDPALGGHNSHQGLSISELNLMRVFGLSASASDERDTYRALFLGRATYPGRYGLERPGFPVGPGGFDVDDDGDSLDWLNRRNDDADDTTDEDRELVDEPDEFCLSNPGGSGNDADRPFDLVDLWELLHNQQPFQSRLEYLLGAFNLDAPFAAGTSLGSFRQNLTTLSADPQWVGVGAEDTTDRLQVRVDLNHATRQDYETAFRQAGFTGGSARQMAVNIVDYCDTDDDVTADGPYYGHERQPYINEFFVGRWKAAGSPNEFRAVAVELYNPYDSDINVYQWELRVDTGDGTVYEVVLDDGAANTFVPARGFLTIVSVDPAIGGERYVFDPAIEGKTIVLERPIPPAPPAGSYALPWPATQNVYRIWLVRARQIGLRPSAANGELVVDDTASEIDFNVLSVPTLLPWMEGYLDEDVQRPDAEVNDFQDNVMPGPRHTLGKWNKPAEELTRPIRYSVPIPNRGHGTFGSVGELGEVLNWSQNGNVPYTDDYAATAGATKEQNIKFDLTGDWYAGGGDNPSRRLLDLLCVKRPDRDGLDNDGNGTVDEPGEADWPVYGRLNINTASLEMLRRALSNGPYDNTAAALLANRIVGRRESDAGPFTHLGDLFRNGGGVDLAAVMTDWGTDGLDNDNDGVVDEKDERDARFCYLANLTTTRSNVFTVFVTVEIRDPDRGELLASRKAVAILDRSRAAMTIRYAGATRVSYVTAPVVQRGFRWITD